MSCCPICTYVVKNDYSFLNHIIIRHYWSSFSCGKCLKFVVTNGQQMKRHIPDCGKPKKECKKKHSKDNKVPEAQSSSKSGHKSKKAKKNKTDKEGISAGDRKSCVVHHPNLVQWPLLRSRLPILCIIVHTRPIPFLVTPRSPRSVRSQRSLNRVCTHMHQSV